MFTNGVFFPPVLCLLGLSTMVVFSLDFLGGFFGGLFEGECLGGSSIENSSVDEKTTYKLNFASK